MSVITLTPSFITVNFKKILNVSRRSRVRDATDRLQAVLVLTNIVLILGAFFGAYVLDLSMFYSLVFLCVLTPFTYFFIGRLLARTKRTLMSQKRFVSDVAHELNGAMSVMHLDSESALHATNDNYRLGLSKRKSQELIDALQRDLSGLKNMANIVKNLSTMASYEYKPGKLELARVDLSVLLERLCEAVSKQTAEEKHIRIDIENTAPAYILGNEAALGQMIRNLLDNAVKYSPKGGGGRNCCHINHSG